MLRRIKSGSFAFSKRVGLSRWLGRTAWRRSRLLILGYHGISQDDEHRWAPALFMSPRVFERRLELLRQHGCTVLPLTEAVERLLRRALPERAVVLTFDDGYYNFLAQAFPALRASGFPATVYLTTLRCMHNFPIVKLLLAYALWQRRSTTLVARSLPGVSDGEYPLESAEERNRLADAFLAEIKRRHLSGADKDAFVGAIVDSLGADYEWFVQNRRLTLLSPAEVSTLSAAGVAFQLHTHTHVTPVDAEAFRREIRTNRASIGEMTGLRPSHFCYPSGVHRLSYLPVLQSEGIDTATTCDHGLASPRSNPLLLERFVDNERVSEPEFEAWLTGPAACLQAIRAVRGASAA